MSAVKRRLGAIVRPHIGPALIATAIGIGFFVWATSVSHGDAAPPSRAVFGCVEHDTAAR